MTKSHGKAFDTFWSGFLACTAMMFILLVVASYQDLFDELKINSSKQLKIINLPEGQQLSSIDLLNDSIITKPWIHKFSQSSQLDTITIYNSEIETYQDAPPTVKQIPIYKIIQKL